MAWTVLIVDDHAGFRAGARALLEAEGFEVLGEAADGESAVKQVAASAPRSCCSMSNCPGSTASRWPNGSPRSPPRRRSY